MTRAARCWIRRHGGDDRREQRGHPAALAAATDDRIFFDLTGIEGQYAALLRELPGVAVRFAMKACPVDEVLACLAAKGGGFDAAGPNEIEQALATGVPAGRIHYGNTIKSDQDIAAAYRLGVRDFATDSVEDVRAIARPRARLPGVLPARHQRRGRAVGPEPASSAARPTTP